MKLPRKLVKPKRLKPLLAVVLLCAWPARLYAHDGPPYAVLVDKAAGPCVISVWADPDVGTGTFFIILEPTQNGTIPDDITITVAVQPVSGRLPEARYRAVREALRGQVQYKAEVQFDAQEHWRVRVMLDSSRGSGEVATEVEATPPGPGRWGILLYLFPFVAVSVLWIRAFLYRRKRRKASDPKSLAGHNLQKLARLFHSDEPTR
jgi:hypothetical protein